MPLNWGICRLESTTGERKQATISGRLAQSSKPILRAMIVEWLFAMHIDKMLTRLQQRALL
jgi:hypothetical protein